jgi:putative membrane protein
MSQPATATASGNSRGAITGLIVLSAAAIAFLCWLLFFHQAAAGSSGEFTFLAPLEALFNAASAIALLFGLRFIKQRKITAHRNSMITAFVFSSLFLVTYIVHHALQGDMIFAGHGAIRVIYLAILISHIILSAVALPLILIAFFFAFTGRFPQHRKITPITYPLWLYVSVTGVVVYAMLTLWR